MIKNILKARLDKEALKLGEPVDWAKYVLDKSLALFFKYALALPLLGQWKYSSANAISVARLVAVQSEDCGSCVQIEINAAKKRKVAPEVIRNTLEKEYAGLDESCREVALFAEAVLGRTGGELEIGDRLKRRVGEKAFVEISVAIATARFYPTVKRALGFSTECRIDNLRL